MKHKATVIYILFAFLSITLFGFLFMGMMDHGVHGTCPFAFANPISCPEAGEIYAVLYHVNSMEGFSEAVFGAGFLNILLLLTILAGSIIFLYKRAKLKETTAYLIFAVKNYVKLHEKIFVYILLLLDWSSRAQKLNPDGSNNRAYV